MKQIIFILVCLSISHVAWTQPTDFPMGRVSLTDVEMKSYPEDTSANAVILDESGQSFINSDDKLIFELYLKIKIFNRTGFNKTKFSIRLFKDGNITDKLVSVSGSTYNLDGGSLRESKLSIADITVNIGPNADEKKFRLPDVREGCVVEVKYKIESSFKRYFRTWEFQSDIPKVHCEYWTLIPMIYHYSITQRGFLTLTSNESSVVKHCFSHAGARSDCYLHKYVIDRVPAFEEEEFMTAKKNFLSALYFELTGAKFTWKDMDEFLDQNEHFGYQVAQAKELLADNVRTVTAAAGDDLSKAKVVDGFIKKWFTWNKVGGIVTELGVRKAFEARTGNDADINLLLVGALQSLGLNAFPMILSTRDHGEPLENYPSTSGFNYVIASLDINGITYLLDATNPRQPFGLLPMRCLNGKGRFLAKESSWEEITPSGKRKRTIAIDLMLTEKGLLGGKLTITHEGYSALGLRDEISSLGREEYIKRFQGLWKRIEITNYQIENLADPESPLVEKMDIKIENDLPTSDKAIFFNPFIIGKYEKNPLKSSERLYPVDFGAPREETLLMSLNYPSNFEVDELPKNTALTLPEGGGRYVFSVSPINNKLSIVSKLNLLKPAYNSLEYHYLRELMAQVVQTNQSQIVLKMKQ